MQLTKYVKDVRMTVFCKASIKQAMRYGSIFGKRDLLAIDHIMLALFWSYVPNMKYLVDI